MCDTADQETFQAILCTLLPPGTILYCDELAGYQGWLAHFTVCLSREEWARDDDGDSVHEVDCNTSESVHAALRTFLCPFRGVHKAYLACYLAVYEAMVNAKGITTETIRRLCFRNRLHTRYT